MEAGKSKPRRLETRLLGRALRLACRLPSPCVLTGQGEEALVFTASSHRDTNPMRTHPREPPLTLITSQRLHLQILSRWGSELQHRNLEQGEQMAGGHKLSSRNVQVGRRKTRPHLGPCVGGKELGCHPMGCGEPSWGVTGSNQLFGFLAAHF